MCTNGKHGLNPPGSSALGTVFCLQNPTGFLTLGRNNVNAKKDIWQMRRHKGLETSVTLRVVTLLLFVTG